MVSTFCSGCNKQFKKKSKTGYCATCFHKNVDNVKSNYNSDRWISGQSKRSHWKHRGITLFEEEIERHNEVHECDFCNKPLLDYRALDHCHSTGRYRGTLCRECNTGLGKLGDDLDLILERLLRYRGKSNA
jgi:hypothetical protein